MAGAHVTIRWDYPMINYITKTLPLAAHNAALEAAALASSEAIDAKHSGTGQLEADVRRPKHITEYVGAVGSDLVYAATQNFGAHIVPVRAQKLLIHALDLGDGTYTYGRRYPAGTPGGLGGQFGTRDVVAAVDSVDIPAKHYLDVAPPVYMETVMEALKAGFP